MSNRAGTFVAWGAAGLTSAVVGAATWIEVGASRATASTVLTGLGMVAFGLVGATVVSRRSGHRVGWVMCGVGLAFATHQLAYVHAITAHERGWAGATWSAWYGSWGYTPAFLLGFVVLPLLFPDGHLPSPRWRPVVWLGAALLITSTADTLGSATLEPGGYSVAVDNPLHIGSLSGIRPLVEVGLVIAFVSALVASTSAIIVRYKRSSAVERHQVKWFLAAAGLVPVGFAVSTVPGLDPYADHVWGTMLLALPVAIGVAVLRYRLFEIDRIISRTVSYALVLATLAGIYAAGVVGLGTAMRAATGRTSGDLIVAASTLAAAAAFIPARRRLQAIVDRRFNRPRYDRQRTIEAFTARLRDEMDLDVLTAELRDVASQTMRPTSTSMWMTARVHR